LIIRDQYRINNQIIKIMSRSAKYISVFIILCGLAGNLSAQVSSFYEVAAWPDFRNCAVSYTFDDGFPYQFSKAIPIFDEFDYKLTLFLISSWSINWDLVRDAATHGHEIGNHTATHPRMNLLTAVDQEKEIKVCNELINSSVPDQKCVTMASPFCAEGNDSVAAIYFIAVRGCQGFIENKTPQNFMSVSSLACGNLSSVNSTAVFKDRADQAATKGGWLVYLLHGLDDDNSYSPLSSDTLRKSLEYLKANDTKFWVSTFGNVTRYIKERDDVSVVEKSAEKSQLTVAVTDKLKNEIFNYPLTIRRVLPEGWKSATVNQNGKPVKYSILESGSVKYIQFYAVPDGGDVVIRRSKV
jgi:peptidoglycan/xylan/chitin deacetylase (PgdA/CDA1 family)